MNTFVKFALGAIAGVATLGAAAGIYCNFFRDDEDDSDSFAELELDSAPDTADQDAHIRMESATDELQPA